MKLIQCHKRLSASGVPGGYLQASRKGARRNCWRVFTATEKNGTEDIKKAHWYLAKYIELTDKDNMRKKPAVLRRVKWKNIQY